VSKTILITGAGGQVSHELATADSPHRLVALTQQQLDITNPVQIIEVFKSYQPDILINAAAYTQVDLAEKEQKLAFAINHDGVANLAQTCKMADIPMLHISTDYVFDGSKLGAYKESDPVAALGVYGQSKAAGDAALQATLKQHIILRTSWVFSVTGNNFVKTMLRLGREREELNIVDDQHGCPTSARSIAVVLLSIADRYLQGDEIEWGTYHYCNQPETTWFGFATVIFLQAGGFEHLKLNPITTSDYPTPAGRPQNSRLDCAKIKAQFGIELVSWADELGLVLDKVNDWRYQQK
jgi:dTDP-4-dehydrorhamnose reductase